jgi:hypothetical protein
MIHAPDTSLSSISHVGRLQFWLLAGAAVDLAGALQLLIWPKKTEKGLDIPLQEGFWPTYAAVFLIVLTVLYVVTAMNPVRLLPIVGVAIVGRFIGGAFYWLYAWKKPGRQWLLMVFGAMNVALLVAYVWILQANEWREIVSFLCLHCPQPGP